MVIFRTAVVVTLAAVVFHTAGCRKYGRSLALPARPQLPYIYSQKDYDNDVAAYDADAPAIADPAKQKSAQAARNDISWGLMCLLDDLYNV